MRSNNRGLLCPTIQIEQKGKEGNDWYRMNWDYSNLKQVALQLIRSPVKTAKKLCCCRQRRSVSTSTLYFYATGLHNYSGKKSALGGFCRRQCKLLAKYRAAPVIEERKQLLWGRLSIYLVA